MYVTAYHDFAFALDRSRSCLRGEPVLTVALALDHYMGFIIVGTMCAFSLLFFFFELM